MTTSGTDRGSRELAHLPDEPEGPGGPSDRIASDTASAVDSAVYDGGEPEFVAPPEHIREAARLAPDHWIGYFDLTWSGDGPPPTWALVGQWRSNGNGEIVAFKANEGYRPSPASLGWPEPTDPVDAAVQLAVTGYGPAEDVAEAVVGAELVVMIRPDGELLTTLTPDGAAVVPAFSSTAHAEFAGLYRFLILPLATLLDRLPEEHSIYLNPSGPAAMVLGNGPVREARSRSMTVR